MKYVKYLLLQDKIEKKYQCNRPYINKYGDKYNCGYCPNCMKRINKLNKLRTKQISRKQLKEMIKNYKKQYEKPRSTFSLERRIKCE